MFVVLVVSEEDALKASVRAILEGEYLLLEASAIPDAAKTLLSHPTDVVLLDAPQGRTKLLYAINRLWEVRRTVPIVLFTPLSEQGWIEEVLDYGVFEVLPKPFGKSELLAVTKRATRTQTVTDLSGHVARDSRVVARRELDPELPAKGTLQSLIGRIQPLLRGLSNVKDVGMTAMRIVEGMTELFGSSSGILLLDDGDDFEYRPIASTGVLTADTSRLSLGPRSELVRRAMGERRILLRNDYAYSDSDPGRGLTREMDLLGAQAVVPLWRGGRLFALFALGNRITGVPYAAEDLEALGILTGPVQNALESALEFREVSTRGQGYQVIVQDLGSGVITTDCQGRVTAINQKAERILGVEAPLYLGKPIQKLSSRIADMLLRTLEKKETFSRHEFRYGKEGILLGASSSLLRNAKGEVVGAVLTFTDITETRRRETRRIEDLKLSEILNLSAWMAHQVKNPLVSIKTFTEMLPAKFSDKEFREKFTEIVGGEVGRLDGVINKLVRFGDELRMKRRATPVEKLTGQVVTDLGEILRERKLDVKSMREPVDATLDCDPALLRDALLSLFSNVVQSAEAASKLELCAEVRHKEGAPSNGSDSEGPCDVIEIRLYDPKRPASRVGRVESLFESYEEGRPDYDLLGIAFAHKIIRAHNGWVEEGRSDLGETDIRISLPCRPATAKRVGKQVRDAGSVGEEKDRKPMVPDESGQSTDVSRQDRFRG
jgi:PAS domain S-box-containing protein